MSAALQPWLRTDWTSGSNAPHPISPALSAPSATRISRVPGKDVTTFTFDVDEYYAEWQARLVPSEVSPVTAGTLIEASAGLVPNGSFETDIAGWTSSGVTTFARQTGWASLGAASARLIASPAANGTGRADHTLASGSVVAGALYRLLIDLNLNSFSGTSKPVLFLNAFTAANAYLGQQIWAQGTLNPVLGAERADISFVAPASTGYFTVTVSIQGQTAGGTGDMYFDNVRLLRAPDDAISVSITDDELVAAGAADGEQVVKLFTRDMNLNWSL